MPPTRLRKHAAEPDAKLDAAGTSTLRLSYRPPIARVASSRAVSASISPERTRRRSRGRRPPGPAGRAACHFLRTGRPRDGPPMDHPNFPTPPARPVGDAPELSRRGFLRVGALAGGGLAAVGLAACAPAVAAPAWSYGPSTAPAASGSAAPAPSASPSDAHGSHAPSASAPPSATPVADHDANATAVVDRFLGGEAATAEGNQPSSRGWTATPRSSS